MMAKRKTKRVSRKRKEVASVPVPATTVTENPDDAEEPVRKEAGLVDLSTLTRLANTNQHRVGPKATEKLFNGQFYVRVGDNTVAHPDRATARHMMKAALQAAR